MLAHELTHVNEGVPGASGVPMTDLRREGEAKARMVEKMVLAKEKFREQKEEKAYEPQKLNIGKSQNVDSEDKEIAVTIDKAALEEKTYEILQKLLKLEQERNGYY